MPAHELLLNPRAYVPQWSGASKVVFHCMMSQIRGPKCARAFAQAAAQAHEEMPESRVPQVCVLEGGFAYVAASYDQFKDIVEDFDFS